MIRLFLIFINLFIIISCKGGVKKLPDENLGSTKVNNFYHQMIFLPNGVVDDFDFKCEIQPAHIGLICSDTGSNKLIKNYNNIPISGTPSYIGEVYIDFDWHTFGTNISTGKHFQKRYILKVEE